MCIWVGTCHRMCVEVREHLCELGSSLPPVRGSRDRTWVFKLVQHVALPAKQSCQSQCGVFARTWGILGQSWGHVFSSRVLGNHFITFISNWRVGCLGTGLSLLGKRHSWPSQRIEPLSHPVILFRKQQVGEIRLPPSINATSTFSFGYVFVAYVSQYVCF